MTTTIDQAAATAAVKDLVQYTNYGPAEASAVVLDGGAELVELIAGAVADSRRASVSPRRAIQTTLASFGRQRDGRQTRRAQRLAAAAATLADALEVDGQAFPQRGLEVEIPRTAGGTVKQLTREDLAEPAPAAIVAACPACKLLLEHFAHEDAGGFLTWRCPAAGCGHTRLIINEECNYPPAGVGR